MPDLKVHTRYCIELCSGEQRCWEYLGPDGRGVAWWRDAENGREFSEDSLLYVWQVVGETPPA